MKLKIGFGSPTLFFSAPLMGSCLITLLTFDLPGAYLVGVGLLMCIALISVLLDFLLAVRLPSKATLLELNSRRDFEKKIGLLVGWGVLASCLVDLIFFPLPLLNPSIYANFENGRSIVRHVSNMCWILPVIGILCISDRRLRVFFILVGLSFPIMVLDRNRLFASVYSFTATVIMFTSRKLPLGKISAIMLGVLIAFAELGKLRSGNLEWIDLPFSDFYSASNTGIRWILLYVSAGVYNFSSIVADGYTNADFLINQIVPLAGGVETLGTTIPFDSAVINVGTEYFPFLMAFGPLGAVTSAFVLFFGLIASVAFFRTYPSLFTLLLFLRITYVCLMAGFAPQAYTWTNFGFIIFCIFMLAASNSISKKMDFKYV